MLMMILSNLFVMSKHPVYMGMILLIQTTLISLISGMKISNFWFSYILFIIMIGGLMIIFIYMTSTINKKKFNPKIKMKSFLLILIISLVSFSMENKLNLNYEIMNLMIKYFLMTNLLMFLISYLFFTLISISKLTMNNLNPLRKN